MRALIQRVTRAEVAVGGETLGTIGDGLLILACAMRDDNNDAPARLASKIAKLRIFRDGEGRMNLSLLDTSGAALVVSQFTLAAETSRGNRPGFSLAADPATGERLYLALAHELREMGIDVSTGRFGADMALSLVNDGPVTIWLDTGA